jgi:hypothetical protein
MVKYACQMVTWKWCTFQCHILTYQRWFLHSKSLSKDDSFYIMPFVIICHNIFLLEVLQGSTAARMVVVMLVHQCIGFLIIKICLFQISGLFKFEKNNSVKKFEVQCETSHILSSHLLGTFILCSAYESASAILLVSWGECHIFCIFCPVSSS